MDIKNHAAYWSVAGLIAVLVPVQVAVAQSEIPGRAAKAPVAAAVLQAPVVAHPKLHATSPKVIRSAALPPIALGKFQNAKLPGSLKNDRGLRLGSIGSGLFRVGPNEYWTVTDRGPNAEVIDDVHTFVTPKFDPTLVHVKVRGKRIEVLGHIPITTTRGKPVTGLPNRAFGEESLPLAANAARVLPFNINGLDPEGVARTPDGHFWISEEYAPSLVELDSKGRVLTRYLPKGTVRAYRAAGVDYRVKGSLPAAFAYRKDNRGLEDVALLPDRRTLVTALQSSIVVPGQKDRIVTELLTFDTKTGKTLHEFPYQFDYASTFGDRGRKLKISALAPVDQHHVIVQERTDFQSRYYQVRLNPKDPIIAYGNKKLVVNLAGVKGVPGKIEGVALKDRNTLVLSSDNDFGFVPRAYGRGESVDHTRSRTRFIEVRLK